MFWENFFNQELCKKGTIFLKQIAIFSWEKLFVPRLGNNCLIHLVAPLSKGTLQYVQQQKLSTTREFQVVLFLANNFATNCEWNSIKEFASDELFDRGLIL